MSIVASPRAQSRLRIVLLLGLAFLYAPILLVVLFSFNNSTSTTVWSGFSLHWYGELFQNPYVLNAARVSLEVAALSATGATVIGTLAGYTLSRFGRFRARTPLAIMATAPLIMPEIVLAVSLLLLFVWMEKLTGWPHHRGVMTITLAHITYTAAFATIVVQGRLSGLDRSIEEAATDLGATPIMTFLLVTLPLIAPGVAAAWLLGFSISLDDVVITQFTSGPGSTTLPLLIFSLVRRGVKPDINAIATLFVTAAVVVTVGLGLLQRWRSQQQAADRIG
jgi:putrescine transport system permease protein